jgi:hypothetical protein
MASISPTSSTVQSTNLQNAIVAAQRQVQQDQNTVQQNDQRLTQSQQALNRDQSQLEQSQQQSRAAQQTQSLQPVQQPSLDSAIKVQSPPAQAVPSGLIKAQVNTQGQTIGSVINVTA